MRHRTKLIGTITAFVSVLVLSVIILLVVHSGARVNAQGSINITGTVTNANGQDTDNVSVYATDPGTSNVDFGPVATNSSGYYDLQVEAGTYDFHFVPQSGSGFDPVVDSNVTISNGQTIDIQLTPIATTNTFSGYVTDSNGNAIPGLIVSVGNSYQSNTDPTTGYFSITAPSTYAGSSVSFSDAGGDEVNGYPLTQFDVSSPIPTNFSNGNTTQSFTINPLVELSITANDVSGNPESGVAVSAAIPGPQITATSNGNTYFFGGGSMTEYGETDTNGTFTEVVPEGETFAQGDICANFSTGVVCNNTAITVTGNTSAIFQEELPSPSNLSAVTPTNQYPSLSWNAVSDAMSYNIYRNGTEIGSTTSATTYTDSSAPQGSNSYYVTAVNASGESSASNTITVVYDTTPPTIGNVSLSPSTITTGQTTKLTIDASDSLSGLAGAEYFIDSDPGQGNGSSIPVTGFSRPYTVYSVTFGSSLAVGTYSVYVRAKDNAGNWTQLRMETLQVNSPIPAAPTNFAASTSPTNQYPSLFWIGSSGATSYNIYENGTYLGSTDSTTYVDSSASQGNDNYYVTAVNSAGESNASNTVVVDYDIIPPTITYTLTPAPNASGWNNSNVTVSFTCSDTNSGVASCPNPVTVSSEGKNIQVSGTAADEAGNTATATASVNLDKTPPTISYSLSPTPNSAGWNNSNVTVTFTCSDALSGIATCPSPVTVSTEAANQKITGTATDKAGNTASTTATINLDKTPPMVSRATMSPTTILLSNNNVAVSASATDSLSGVSTGEYYIDTDPGQGKGKPMTYNSSIGKLTATASISGLSLGTHKLYVRAKDVAGSWSTPVSVSFTFI